MSLKINPVNKSVFVKIPTKNVRSNKIPDVKKEKTIDEIDKEFIDIIKSGDITKKFLKQFIKEKINLINNIDDY